MRLPDERKVAVVGIEARGPACGFDGCGVGRTVDVEVFQAKEIAARGIRDRPHPVDAYPGDMLHPSRADTRHGQTPFYRLSIKLCPNLRCNPSTTTARSPARS